MSRSCKLVVIGDGAVGKTCLLVVYAKGQFPSEYVPTIFENYKCKVTIDGEEISIQLWDTAGQEDLDNIRTLSYPGTDVFILCFAINERASLENIQSKWLPELREHGGQTKDMLLVGLKSDLRGEEPDCVTPQEGAAAAKRIGAFDYVECSARLCQNVKEVFDGAIVRAARAGRGGGGGGSSSETGGAGGGCCRLA